MKRVVVTGGTGFIGRQILPLLRQRGYEVHATTHTRPGTEPGVVWHPANLLDPARGRELLKSVRPTHLLHLAWYAVPGKFWESPENDEWRSATEELFAGALAAGVQRILGVGSCAEYAWGPEPCSEIRTLLLPSTRYGRCKLQAFESLLTLATRAGTSAAWARVFHLYGPYEHPTRLVPSLIRSLRRGERFVCASGDHLRDFLHVRDVAAALGAVLESPADGPVNVAAGAPVAVRQVVDSVARQLGAGRLVDFGSSVPRATDPPVLIADASRLRDEVGWQPAIPLEAGLEESVRWWCSVEGAPDPAVHFPAESVPRD